ncbi:MAG: BamA/TamA family outer membrane protein, partial [Pseudomonadota bacterium]
PLSTASLRADLARIYGLGLFEQVDYRWQAEGDTHGIEIDARAKSWGPGYMRFGLSLEEDFEGSSAFAISARYLQTAMNRLGAEWRTSLRLGTNTLLESEFYQPLSFDLRYFVAPIVSLNQRNVALFSGSDRLARYRLSTLESRIDVGRELGNWGELRLGIFRGAGNARVKVGDPALQRLDFNTGGYRASFGFDTLDDTVFPSRGSRYELELEFAREALASERDYETLISTYAGYRTFGRHTWSVGLDLATSNDADDIIEESYLLGGFLNLSGLDRGALAGPHAAVGRVVYQRRMGSTGGGLFDWPLYLGGSLEAGNVWATRDDVSFGDLVFNGSLFARFDTFFGPFYLATGFGESGETTVYLFLGATAN